MLEKLEAIGLPFAPIGRPEDLFEDPHMVEGGGLAAITLPDGGETRLDPADRDGRPALQPGPCHPGPGGGHLGRAGGGGL
ncbi:MAG: hypothetical protein QM681_07325 [Novosphingobium sp.]